MKDNTEIMHHFSVFSMTIRWDAQNILRMPDIELESEGGRPVYPTQRALSAGHSCPEPHPSGLSTCSSSEQLREGLKEQLPGSDESIPGMTDGGRIPD